MALFYNVVGSAATTVELLAPDSLNKIKSLMLTNVHASNDATATVFIQKITTAGVTEVYNFIHTINIPAHTSLLLDDSSLFRFPAKFGLYITVGSSDTVDVIISN